MNTENLTYCPKCEDAIPDNLTICDHCGSDLCPTDSETETVGREMMRMRLEDNYTISPATRNVALSLLIVVISGISIAACNL
jgi:methionyl-tRNA synthetase